MLSGVDQRSTMIPLTLFSLFTVYVGFRAATDVQHLVSPQGCRMSWMSPSYLLESEFNTSWTPLASRYSLWLYREAEWEPSQAMGLPVLFIPGSAGSAHQVRSIASSAARQYFSSPLVVSPEFTGGAKPLDFYAVEFNEDFSAFHGRTLDAEIAYTSAAVSYILSRYRPGTQIIVMGHSMGGIVGAALLPSDNIKVLITMSTPHTLAPARFDAGIAEVYARTLRVVRGEEQGQTPILSICGGAADGMIPSESCILPSGNWSEGLGNSSYRRTVFTSALEGAWTGVGHREMVWCHQVRWRIARAALELGRSQTVDESARALDRWLRDGSVLPLLDGGSAQDLVPGEMEYEALPGNVRLVLNRPLGKRTYLMPIPSTAEEDGAGRFLLYVSQGKVLNVAPRHAFSLHVSVQLCAERDANATVSCKSLAPASLRLLPAPIPDKPFPVPDEGADESEGVVFFEAEIPHETKGWVGVTVDAGDDGSGWVTGGFDQALNVGSEIGLRDVLFGSVTMPLRQSDHPGSKMEIRFPRLPSTALLVYRLVPEVTEIPSCSEPLSFPLLMHTSGPSEIHYHRLVSNQPIFLHTHSHGPYINHESIATRGLNITVHSASCQEVAKVDLSVDWWVSMGRIATRYPTLILGWGIGIVCLMVYHSMTLDGQRLSVGESLVFFLRHRMFASTVVVGIIGGYGGLGIGDNLGVLGVVLAAFLFCIAVGMVCFSWMLLATLMRVFKLLGRGLLPRKPEDARWRRRTLVILAVALGLTFLNVPWQVVFVGCWIAELLNCIATSRVMPYPGSVPTLASTPTASTPIPEDEDPLEKEDSPVERSGRSSQVLKPTFANVHNQNTHILLLMTWLLPQIAPLLAAWMRTVQTAGYMTPFNGNYSNVLYVSPWLVLVNVLGRGRPLNTTGKQLQTVMQFFWLIVAFLAFCIAGGRFAYMLYGLVSYMSVMLLLCHIVPFKLGFQ